MAKLSAKDISDSLQARFEGEHLTFTEAKSGPSVSGMRRMDFLAIKKTWSPVTIIAVEVKRSRSDFVRDQKWPEYLKVCNQFYWACPKGLIKKDEIDPRCGLIYINESTHKARTARKALYRDAPPDPNLLLYLLFWRMREPTKNEVLERVRADMAESAEIGKTYRNFVSRKLTEADERVRKSENAARSAGDAAFAVTSWMAANGVNAYELKRLLKTAYELQNWRGAERELVNALSAMETCRNALTTLKQCTPEEASDDR